MLSAALGGAPRRNFGDDGKLAGPGRGRQGATVCSVTQHRLEENLPPLASPEASEDERGRAIEARMVARHGAPSLEDYRRAYASCGAEWPGDEEIRRRHPVAPDSAA